MLKNLFKLVLVQ